MSAIRIIKPRLLWVCPHTTLRYEEVPLLIEAGAEVIPSLHIENYFWIEPQYDNEQDIMYPNWRGYCTMPVHIVEKIRRTNIISPSDVEADLINQWIDIIYIAFFPSMVEAVLRWFKGKVIARSFGGQYSYTDISSEETVHNLSKADNMVWCPILKAITEREDPQITRNLFYLPGFVSQERLPFEWLRKLSLRKISTLLSYIHISDWYRRLYRRFDDAFREIDHTVLGKNDKKSIHCQNPSITGQLDYKPFYSTMCNTRLFCYGGEMNPYHLHFTPIEAMTMRIPVLFHESCGLTREAIENGLKHDELAQLGMCKDYRDMAETVKRIIDDFEYLDQLRHKQYEVLLPLFGRSRALSAAKKFLDPISAQIAKSRTYWPSPDDYVNDNDPMSGKNMNYANTMPGILGEKRFYPCRLVPSFTGEELQDPVFQYVRYAKAGKNPPGILAGQYVRFPIEGQYELSVTLEYPSSSNGKVYLTFAVWNPDYQEQFALPLSANRPGLHSFRQLITIPPSLTEKTKEWRITWMGDHDLKFIHACIKKISNSTY